MEEVEQSGRTGGGVGEVQQGVEMRGRRVGLNTDKNTCLSGFLHYHQILL